MTHAIVNVIYKKQTGDSLLIILISIANHNYNFPFVSVATDICGGVLVVVIISVLYSDFNLRLPVPISLRF